MKKPWEILFSHAINQLSEAGIPKNEWSFGGGTVLRQKFNHRESKDVDIFFRSAQYLPAVSPRVNDAVEANLRDYMEAAGFVRLTFPEGEVDFIAAPQLTNAKPVFKKVAGHHVYVDQPVEIVAKKIQFRAEEFKPRDVFDLAVVFESQREIMLKNSAAFSEKLDTLDKRLNDLKGSGHLDPYLERIDIRPGGEKVRGKEYDICKAFSHAVRQRLQLDAKIGRTHSPDTGLCR